MDKFSPIEITAIIDEIDAFSKKMREIITSLSNINEDIDKYNGSNSTDYLKEKQIQVATQIISSFFSVTSESLSRQLESSDAFKKHYESFFLQSDSFNQSIITEQNRINNLNSEMLKKRSLESLRSQINDFYSIYNSSINV